MNSFVIAFETIDLLLKIEIVTLEATATTSRGRDECTT